MVGTLPQPRTAVKETAMDEPEPTFDLLVRGDLVLPGGVLRGGALAVRDGRMAGLFEPGIAVAAAEVRDYSGRYVLPGLVDTHVHALSTPVEGIARATAAAAAGGGKTVGDMPYDSPD